MIEQESRQDRMRRASRIAARGRTLAKHRRWAQEMSDNGWIIKESTDDLISDVQKWDAYGDLWALRTAVLKRCHELGMDG